MVHLIIRRDDFAIRRPFYSLIKIFIGLIFILNLTESSVANAEADTGTGTTSASASGTAIPLYCYYDNQNPESTAPNVVRSAKCSAFDLDGMKDSKNYTLTNVCIFKDRAWQLGTLKIFNVGANATLNSETQEREQTLVFESKIACTHGIEVLQTQGNGVTVFGPTKINAYNDCLGSDFASKTKAQQLSKAESCSADSSTGFNSSYFWGMNPPPSIPPGDVVLACYRDEGNYGIERRSDVCAPFATDAGYCEKVELTADNQAIVGSIHKAGYKGSWFIRYNKSGKREPKICAGGVLLSDPTDASGTLGDDYQKRYNQKFSGTTTLASITEIVDNLTGETKSTDVHPSVIGCYVSNGYKTCAQTGGCSDVSGCGNTTAAANPVGKFKKGECFYSNPGPSGGVAQWVIVSREEKGVGKASESCSAIDVVDSARVEPDDRKSAQNHPNITTEPTAPVTAGSTPPDFTVTGSIHIGNNETTTGTIADQADNKGLQIGWANGQEVIGLGINPLEGDVCKASPTNVGNRDCTLFRIPGQNPNTDDQGILYVNGGTHFQGNIELRDGDANFKKNVTIGTANENPANKLIVHADFNLTNNMTVGTSGDKANLTVYGDISTISAGTGETANLSVGGDGTIDGNLTVGTTTAVKTLTMRGSINVSGGITADGIIRSNHGTTITSDRRLKTKIQPLSNALEKILKLNGIYYEFDTKKYPNRHFTSEKKVGLIAQDLLPVFPEVVYKDADGFFSVAYTDLIAPIIESIKSLYEEMVSQNKKTEIQFQKLEQKINDLVLENKKLREKINTIEKKKNNEIKK